MSNNAKMRWRQMTTVTRGFADLLDRHKREHGSLHDPDIIAGAAEQAQLIIEELPTARCVAPVDAGALAVAGLHLADAAGLKGKSVQRMTTEALCTLKSLRQGVIATKYADHLEGALHRYGDAGVIKDARERGILSGSWSATVTSNTPNTTTDEPVVRPSGPSQGRGLGGSDWWL